MQLLRICFFNPTTPSPRIAPGRRGCIDRVQIELDPGGEAVAAKVYDFKTDKGPVDLYAKYKDQLDSYAVAAALLLGIPRDRDHAEPLGVRAPKDPG